MNARERLVRVVTEALRETGLVTYYDVMAEAVVTALEAGMGLHEEDDIEWCDAETWIDYASGSEWARCNNPADHEGRHEHVNGGTWPRDPDDPRDRPKPREYRLVTDWMSDEGDA